MRWKTHESIAMLSYSISLVFLYPVIDVFRNVILLIFSIVPLIASTLPDKLDKTFDLKHREFSHSLLCCTLLSGFLGIMIHKFKDSLGLLNLLPVWSIWVGFLCGYLTHIMADSFTDKGVRLEWPLNTNKPRMAIYKLWSYSSGKEYEQQITLVSWSMVILIWLSRLFFT